MLAAFTALVFVDALVGDRGLLTLIDAKADYERLDAAVGRLRAENQRLRDEARRLRTDPGAIEEVARRDLGFIRPGETVFIVRDARPPIRQ
jgi:cell division protein FtsB